MKMKKLHIENFLSISSVDLCLDEYSGITLIEGINNDSSTSMNNGAGKSSIIESIIYVLTGKTKRGYSGDEVVNNVAKKNCHVSLVFEISGVDYIVHRYRKDETLGNLVSILQINGEEFINLTKGTAKETQKLIESIIGMSELTLSKMLYFGQEDVRSFAGLTDAELKSVFEEAMGLCVLSEHEAIIKNEITLKKEELNSKKHELERLEMSLQNNNRLMETLHTSSSEFETTRKNDIEFFSEKVKSIEAEIKEVDLHTADITSALQTKIMDFESRKEQFENLLNIKNSIDLKLNEKHEQCSVIKYKIDSLLREAESLKATVESSTKKVGQKCTACNRPFKPEDISGLVEASLQRLDVLQKDSIISLNNEYSVHVEEYKTIKSQSEKLNVALDKILVIKTEASRAESTLKEMTVKPKRDLLTDIANQYYAKIAEVKSCANPHVDKIFHCATEFSSIKEKIGEVNASVYSINNVIEDLQLLQSCFSNSGIKNRIFDNITPELNRVISEYMNFLDEIDVEITTMKKLKTGGVREKFEILVSNRNGASDYKGNSGGEKQKIDLCISLAFNSLMRKTVKSPLNILFLDEPFESLDQGSSEAAISLCNEISKDTNVFIITHNPAIKDLVSNKILIEKKSGQSTLAK